MNQVFLFVQILTGVFLIGLVTVQNKGTGFSRSWKAQSSFTRRGLEKVFFKLTFIITGLFILVSILQVAL